MDQTGEDNSGRNRNGTGPVRGDVRRLDKVRTSGCIRPNITLVRESRPLSTLTRAGIFSALTLCYFNRAS
jgi:hypothetical protein